jgi:folate-binding protein YgfZ
MAVSIVPDRPLEALLNAAGAAWVELPGAWGAAAPWSTPLDYGDADAESRVVLEGVGLSDLTQRGMLAVSGLDRARWLHGLCTQHIKGLQPMQGGYACHVDIKGRIQADLWALNAGEVLLLDVEPGVARPLRRVLKGFIVMEQVKLVDRSGVMGAVGVVGPQSARLLSGQAPDVAWEQLPVGHAHPAVIAGVECLVWRVGRVGGLEYQLVALREELASLWSALREAGASPVGWTALERARLRAGRPRFGAELSGEVLFNEAELQEGVSFNKGCYLGQEIIERVDARGNINRRLRTLLQAPGRPPLPVGATLRNAERRLGEVTSAAWLPELGRSVALGFLHRSDNAPGAVVQAELPSGELEEVVVSARGVLDR